MSKILALSTFTAEIDEFSFQRTDKYIRTLCHVSHVWRLIALNCPQLWTAIDIRATTEAGRINFASKNARQLPISLHIDFGNVSSSTSAQVVMPDSKVRNMITRLISGAELSKLAFRGSMKSLVELLPVFSQSQSLRTIIIRIGAPRQDLRTEGPVISRRILCMDGIPGLQVLKLTGCTLPLTSPVLLCSPHLTHLSLNVFREGDAQELLDMLRKLPLLQWLFLRLPHPLDSHTLLDNESSIVHLPRLNSLILEGGPGSILAILPHLRLSATLFTFRARCKTLVKGDQLQRVGEQIFAALGQARSPAGSPQQITVGNSNPQQGGSGPYLVFLETGITGGGRYSGTSVHLQLFEQETFRPLSSAHWIPLAVVPYLSALDSTSAWTGLIAELETVVANGNVEYPDDFWKSLSTYPKLARICIGTKDTLKLLPFIFSEHDKSYDEGNEDGSEDEYSPNMPTVTAFPFPSLRHIEVQVQGSESRSASPHSGIVDTSCNSLLESFVHALQLRRELALQYPKGGVETLQSLTFLDCEVAPNRSLVPTLSSLVHRFVWKRRKPAPSVGTTCSTQVRYSCASGTDIAHIFYDSDEELEGI